MKSCLSILSHVVHGYVGNRATVFPLQYAGWDVDAINTTNYSNHPGYGTFSGAPALADLVRSIIDGLKKVLDMKYDMILMGYTPSADVLQVVFEELCLVFSKYESAVWIVDPVLGDNGKFYVLEAVVPRYHDILKCGHVALVTPNQFEMEVLSGVKISTWEDVLEALASFDKQYQVKNVVISSVNIDGQMFSVGHTTEGTFKVPIQVIECSFNGCGDLFAGLLASAFYDAGRLDSGVLGGVLDKLYKVLQRSYEEEKKITSEVKVVKDLRIVQLREYL